MAEVRSVVTVPVTAQFAGLGAPTPASPLAYVDTTGDLYVLITPDTVVKIGSVVSGADLVLAQQVFGKHMVPQPVTVQDVSEHLANRAFDRQIVQPQPSPQDAQWQLADRSFSRNIQTQQAISASDILAARSFLNRPFTACWR